MSESVNVYEAKTHLPQLLDAVEAGESVIMSPGASKPATYGRFKTSRCVNV